MPTVKVHYFNIKGVAEPTRLLLAYGGQKFEDVRFKQEDWPTLKQNFKYGQVPVLEIDGKQYAQSMSINRFLGHKYGLAGSNPEEDFEIDEVMDYYTELRSHLPRIYQENDEKKKALIVKEIQETIIPRYCEKLNEIIGKNNGHFALNKLTWADFVLTGQIDALKFFVQIPDLEKKYPNFKRVIDNVLSQPKLKSYLANAPKTDM